MTFYMTYARSRPDTIAKIAAGTHDIRIFDGQVRLVEREHDGVPLMTNAFYRWSEAKQRFLDPWEYDTERVIDSGGYNVQARFVDQNGDLDVSKTELQRQLTSDTPFFPWGIDEYHSWLKENSGLFEWVAVMDYACEDRFNCLWDYQQRIDATIANTVRHFELHDGEYQLLPVLQGRTADDYVECYERLEDRGVPVKRVGLGTVCRLSSSKKIVALERELRERLELDYVHGFGVKRDSFNRGVGFESADSQAWVWDASMKCNELVLQGDRLESYPCDNSRRRTVVSFREYYRYMKQLMDGEDPLEPLSISDRPVQTTLV